jgi:hypothetical protein
LTSKKSNNTLTPSKINSHPSSVTSSNVSKKPLTGMKPESVLTKGKFICYSQSVTSNLLCVCVCFSLCISEFCFYSFNGNNPQ